MGSGALDEVGMTKPLLTAAERNAANTARVLKSNSASRFATPFVRDPNGINTEKQSDAAKTRALQQASI